jgi:hypothetical protein
LRDERREQIISAALTDDGDTQLIVVRSDGAAAELRRSIATALDVAEADLVELGILVQSVFSPWPDLPFDRCICAGYFGNRSLDAMFASGAKRVLLIADPIEARVALFDVERKYRSLPHLPQRLQETLAALVNDLEPVAAPITDVNDLLNIFNDRADSRESQTAKREQLSRAPQVLLFFTDGFNMQISSNSRMEVLGRTRLRLQSVLARDLEIGDQVVLLNEEEREAFSDRLLNLLLQGLLTQGFVTGNQGSAETGVRQVVVKRNLGRIVLPSQDGGGMVEGFHAFAGACHECILIGIAIGYIAHIFADVVNGPGLMDL